MTRLELIDEATISPATDAAIRDLLCRCFPADAAVFSQTRHWHDSAPAYSIAAWRDAHVVGHVGIVIRPIRAGDVPLSVAGVQNFAIDSECRGTGLGNELMRHAMAEALQRQLDSGLLFCVPQLERYYRALGWRTLAAATTMRDETGARVPTPPKNICMACPLQRPDFPDGSIDLQGRDL